MNPQRRMKLLKILMPKQGNRCCYCDKRMVVKQQGQGIPFPANGATIEHLRRKCEGGTDRLDNIAIACLHCNTRRGSVDWLTYKSYRMGEIA